MEIMKKAKLAVIGVGGLAQSQHIPNLSKIDNAELYAICDLRQEVLDEIGDYYDIKRRFTDYNQILADPDIDGVLIVTREDTHVSLTLEALAVGKHVYVEKPLAETKEGCEKVTAAQKKSGKIVAVGMNRRMAPAYQYAKELLWKQGGPKNMLYRITDSFNLNWGKNFGIGHRLVHEVCHVFDILRFFAESEVKSVYCISSRADDEIITLQFESGVIATIMSSGYVNSNMAKEHFEAIAETGGVIVNEFTEVKQYSLDNSMPNVKTFAGHSHPMRDELHVSLLKELGYQGLEAVRRVSWDIAEKVDTLEKNGDTDSKEYLCLVAQRDKLPARNYFMNKGWRDAVEDFAEAILTDRDFAGAKAFDGLQATLITEAAVQSRSSGEPVKL